MIDRRVLLCAASAVVGVFATITVAVGATNHGVAAPLPKIVQTLGLAPIWAVAGPQDRKGLLAHPRLLAEGVEDLTNCLGAPKDGVRYCHVQQEEFLVDYVDAFYNHITAQQNVAFLIGGDGGTTMPSYAVQINHLQACAWRIAILGSGGSQVSIGDKWSAEAACSHVGKIAYRAAVIRAKVIDRQIATYTTNGTKPIDMGDAAP